MAFHRRSFLLTEYPAVHLPLSILIHYLFFLSRRPISRSNRHYLAERLRGLKALSRELSNTGDADLEQAVRLLDKITPENFALLNEKLQHALLPLSSVIDELPYDAVVSDDRPPINVFERAHNILLLCGPAIGIGDEIILFPLPSWIKETNPHASITVLSAYSGLWDAVRNVNAVQHYGSYTDLLDVLRSRAPFDDLDVVILADFDRPGLYPAVAFEDSIPCYVEWSLGTEAVYVVENGQRSLYRMPRLAPYFTNFYAGFAEGARWLGLIPNDGVRFAAAADDAGVVQRPQVPPVEPLRIYVSPFTSKYDPSPIYWSRLLCAVLADAPAKVAIQCVLDSGPNATTRRFAREIVRSVSTQVPAHIECSVAEPVDSAMPGLAAALAWMSEAHVVICADSFTAHAAPLFGCLTCVMAASGLANWRVPHRSSYYFRADGDMVQNTSAIRSLIRNYRRMEADERERLVLMDVERRLLRATEELGMLFEQWHEHRVKAEQNGGCSAAFDAERVLQQYREFVDAYAELLPRLEAWPASLNALTTDLNYNALIQPSSAPESLVERRADDVLRHLYDRWWQWAHSNVYKYLKLGDCLHATGGEPADQSVRTAT